MVTLTNMATNIVSIKERWLKLYRTVYNSFLREDFIHRDDYLQDIQQLNQKIATLESSVAAQESAIAVHTHLFIAPLIPAPGPPIPTTPAAASIPPYVPKPLVLGPIVHKDVNLIKKGETLRATGPATAPLGDGASLEAQKATTTAIGDIGI